MLSDSVACVVPAVSVPVGAPFERTGGVVSGTGLPPPTGVVMSWLSSAALSARL